MNYATRIMNYATRIMNYATRIMNYATRIIYSLTLNNKLILYINKNVTYEYSKY